jgi:hypothetical protein
MTDQKKKIDTKEDTKKTKENQEDNIVNEKIKRKFGLTENTKILME